MAYKLLKCSTPDDKPGIGWKIIEREIARTVILNMLSVYFAIE
ncbi:hypothetical protein [Escherichia sp. E4694]|nr:hypothetical protein [Escherichia sp. E4694]